MSNLTMMMGLGSAAGGTPAPDAIGVEYGGGYYAGTLVVDASTSYYLIVAPKSSGESSSKQWKTSNTGTSGTGSSFDGVANTNAMIASSPSAHPAAAFCDGLTINGYDDWYLPSRYELEICYYNLKPTTDSNSTSHGTNPYSDPARTSNYTTSIPAQTSASLFQSGGAEAFASPFLAYHASTSNQSNANYQMYFNNGQSFTASQTDSMYVRAIRRVLI